MNKQFLTIVFFLLISSLTYGQTEKGRFLIGVSTLANPTFGHNKNGDNNFWSVYAGIKGGYFFINNFALGLSGDIISYGTKKGYDRNKTNEYDIMPFARYYLRVKKIGFFGEIRAGITSSYNTNRFIIDSGDIIKDHSNYNVWTYGGGLGVAYFTTKNIAIELSGNVNYFHFTNYMKNKAYSFSFPIGFIIML